MNRSLHILLLVLAVMLVVPGAVAAHAELASTRPEAGAQLETPPTEVALAFDDELDPESSGFVVIGPGRAQVGVGEVDLEVAERNVLRASVEITEPGEYLVTWTAQARDGDVEEGSFGFSVIGPEPTTEPTPDTAVPGPPGATRAIVLVGLMLLVLAGVRFRRATARGAAIR